MAVAGLVEAVTFLGEVGEARRLIPEAIERAERLGNPTILAVAYEDSGFALARMGAQQQAAVMFERGLVHAEAGGPLVSTTYRVHYSLTVDDPHEAAHIVRAAIPIAREHLAGFHQSPPLLAATKIAAGLWKSTDCRETPWGVLRTRPRMVILHERAVAVRAPP
jgi:hypothetical protein